ncbi:sialate O-acetylesterase [Haloferula sp.]|uniref:sialate O-acetylesterase n=1 Tax=Haloferula sp. TaxID=2497595 RepID=UPI00329F9EE8
MKTSLRPLWLTFLLIIAYTPVGHAEATPSLKLAGIFADNMVLQQKTDAAIWGKAEAGQSVSIKPSWGGKSIKTKADDEGKWKTSIQTPPAGGPFQIRVECGKEKIELKNVLSGEVWICSGQSNMQWKLRGFGKEQFKEDVENAKYPEIRLCDIPQALALEEQDDVKSSWKACNPNTVFNFSAVAYFFGSRIHQELDVPIGLISTNWGGSKAEAWVSAETLTEEFPEFDKVMDEYPQIAEEHGVVHPRAPKFPEGLNMRSPTVLYNSMIKPLVPFAFRGVVWYQGESNVTAPVQYRTLFPALIKNWRDEWNIGEFPFYFVQIAPFEYKREPIPVAFLREAQLMTLTVPNTGMAVTMDVGEADNIHPRDKKPVGERLALLALARSYEQEDLVDSGPLYDDFRVVGKEIYLKFTDTGSGLATRDDEALTHFTIAGKDKEFAPAEAVIKGDMIIVSSKDVKKPVAVRFGWGNADAPNLMNKEGLPASSFRTDDWPIKKPEG